VTIYQELEVVETVEDSDVQITLPEAKKIREDIKI
jgi:hypothetical protein